MDDAKIEYQTAIETARTALAAWNEDPSRDKFLTYRDASDLAIKWHRACRLGGAAADDTESELQELLAG